MSARIAPDAIGAAFQTFADYRQAVQAVDWRQVGAGSGSGDAIEAQPGQFPAGPDSALVDSAAAAGAPPSAAEAVAPQPPPEPPGTDYVRAVISGELSPRPTSAQELFLRVGTVWTPPESEYRLTEKIA